MKRLLILLAMTLLSLGIFAQSRYEKVRQVYRSLGYNIGLEEFANLKEGSFGYSTVNFEAGSRYEIVAVSNDTDVKDIDLYVYYPNGELFMEDTDNSNLSVVSFNCTYSQSMKIIIKNYSSLTPNFASTIRYFIAWK